MSRAVLFLFVIANSMVYAQYNQASGNVWVFGDGVKVDFNTTPPQVQTGFNASTLESCASIADCDGNLLFYTNGNQVFNRNQNLMLNGDYLMGDSSSTNGSLITPVLGNNDQYYLFTMDGISCGATDNFDGLHYSVIDISLDFGNGSVLVNEKNVFLTDSVGEKIVAIMHENRRDYWVIVRKHFVNEMYAYLVTPNGIDPTPIISVVNNDYDLFGGVGEMVANRQGNKIAEAVTHSTNPSSMTSGILLYDFDSRTGVVSNSVLHQGALSSHRIFYGCAFSPDDTKLYFGVTDIMNNLLRIRFDDLDNWTPITTPTTILDTFILQSPLPMIGGFKLGSDDMVYFTTYMWGAHSGYLHAICDPNNSSNPDLRLNYIDLGGQNSMVGLPHTYIHNYQSYEDIAGFDQFDVCLGDEVSLGCTECFYYPINYAWKPIDLVYNHEDSVTNSLPIQSDTIFILEMYSPCGEVINRDTALVNTLDCDFPDIYIPSAFSPNSDGANDVFYVRGSDLAHFELKIYDRYGVLVYESNDMSAYWDGTYKDKNLSSQVFIYSLDIESLAGHKEKYKGDLTLIR